MPLKNIKVELISKRESQKGEANVQIFLWKRFHIASISFPKCSLN